MSRPYWNEAAECMPPAAGAAQQFAALREQLQYVAARSKFYQRKFTAAGIEVGALRRPDDVARLPFTEKSELRESQLADPPLGEHRACDAAAVRRIYSTSGTTGRPTFIGLTGKDIGTWRETACRAFWSLGLRPGHVTPLVVSPFVVAASYADALETIGALVPVGVNATDRLIASFQFARANALLCTSSFPLHFAVSLQSRGIDPKALGLRLIMAGGEPGASIPAVRAEIEQTFACRLMECSGNGDYAAMAWAECAERRGMHFIAQGAVYPEIIEPDSGRVLPIESGARGELVVSTLGRECIPLIRFRTRDHVQVTHTQCDCGRTGFGIRIVGRTDDMLIVRGVNVYPSAVRDVVASFAPRTNGVIEIQLHAPPPAGWEPPVHVKIEHAVAADSLDGLCREIEARLREKLIFRARIEPVPAGSLPRYEYKARLVRKLYEAG
jgi:phenylacetate-CoA ligase